MTQLSSEEDYIDYPVNKDFEEGTDVTLRVIHDYEIGLCDEDEIFDLAFRLLSGGKN